MNKIKVMSIFGTRPEAIKMAPLIKALDEDPAIESFVCVTAQHRQMLDQVLEIFRITPDADLDIMANRQTLTDITVKSLTGLESVMAQYKPHIVLVHGDTTTTFAGSLAAYYGKIKLGHVEAGLRTYDKYQPYPEEMNRRLAGVLADIHFAPTAHAKENLLKENTPAQHIFVTGNTAIDGLRTTIRENYTFECAALNKIDFKGQRVITVTAHRRENLGAPLENICRGLLRITKNYPDTAVVYAVHSNPVVRETVAKVLAGQENIYLTPPLNILDMHNLMNNAYMVMTDSGGLQEEVPFMNKPVLVLRNVTERPEGVAAGTLKLAGTNEDKIYEMASLLLEDAKVYEKMAMAENPFGDGYASSRIVSAIKYYFGLTMEKPQEFSNG